VDDSASSRRGVWRILLGVEDDAAVRRALLAAARERRAAGATVVVGCFEPPAGSVTDLDGLPVLPLLSTRYGHDGVDLEAVRQRRPDVVVLADLVRLTPEDAERIPDVDALRLLGIDVISTLFAGDIRSLEERMAVSSTQRRATIPDRALLEADVVEVIAGDSRAELVDLARAWVQRPRPRARSDAGSAQGDQPWPGRIVVALDAEGEADDAIERAADLARLTGVRLVGADIRATDDGADHPRLDRRRRLLEGLDADIVEVVDDSPGWALARIAEAEGAQVIVQRGSVDGPLILDHETASARGLDLYVAASSAPAATGPLVELTRIASPRSAGLSRQRRVRGLALAVVGVPLLTLVLAALRDSLDLSTVLLLYLALTVGVTALGGFGPGLLSALSGFALSVYFFTRPLNRWVIDDPNVIISVAVFVVVAVLVSVLADIAARRSAEAERASAEAAALGQIASAILTTRDPLPRLLHDLRAVFSLDAVAILRPSGDNWTVEHSAGSPVPPRPADAVDALSVGAGRYLVLSGKRRPAEDSRVLAAFTAQLALAVDRRTVVEQP
jgi:two-component system, OmpR family, sensor histidine kinase KdpD